MQDIYAMIQHRFGLTLISPNSSPSAILPLDKHITI